MDQVVRIGIISDSLLQQHLLQSVIGEQGYQIAVNTHPEKLNRAIFHSETISMWVVDIIDEDYHSEILDLLFETAVAPVFIGEGASPDRNSEEFLGWRRRLLGKLEEISPPKIEAIEAPEVDFKQLIQRRAVEQVARLPEHLTQIPKAVVTEVWVLAASLGGPEAVKEFLDRLPTDIPAAFIYAQHIDAGCLDALVNSIGRHAELPMTLMEDEEPILNSRVYVAPVHQEVVFRTDQKIELKDNGWSGPYGPSIDHLLKNIVEGWGKKANLIVFSGMGSDGTLGATLVNDAGGTIWAQSTESSIQPSMPDSVAESDCVSYRGTPTELADSVVKYVESRYAEMAIMP